jgi:hypothetical protein
MSEAELRYGILDLYEKLNLVVQQLLALGPSMIALKETFQEYDPRLAQAYFRHLKAAKQLPEVQLLGALLPLLQQAVERLRIRGEN